MPVDGSRHGQAVARRLAAEGMTVVLVASGGDVAVGRLAAAIEAEGAGRPAVFVADDLDSLVEFLAELFR